MNWVQTATMKDDQGVNTQNWNGLQQINPEATSNHFGLEASLFQPERDLSKNVTIGV